MLCLRFIKEKNKLNVYFFTDFLTEIQVFSTLGRHHQTTSTLILLGHDEYE